MSTKEKRLLLIFFVLLFLVGGVVLFDSYWDRRKELLAAREILENEWIAIETLLEEREKWEVRRHWLDLNQPKFTSDEEISQEIFRIALAEQHPSVRVSKQTLLPTRTTAHFTEVGVSLVAGGSLPDVSKWIFGLTGPESFYAIRNLKIMPDKENQKDILSQMELLRWYTPSP